MNMTDDAHEASALAQWPHATYRDLPFPELNGNIFARALVAPRSYEAWEEILGTGNPPFSPSERTLPNHIRAILVRRLWRYYEPLERHCALAMDIDALLAWTYLGRNPLAPSFIEHLQKSYDAIQRTGIGSLPAEHNRPIEGIVLLAAGGSGKTVTVLKVLAQYPQRLLHAEYGRYQVVHMCVDFPVRVSANELVVALYDKLRALAPAGMMPPLTQLERANVMRVLAKFAHFALQLGVGLIVIDELQNISPESSGGAEIVVNAVQELVNLVRIPIIFVGTLEAMNVLGLNVRSARRASASGDCIWDRLPRSSGRVDSNGKPFKSEFEFVLEGLCLRQLIRKPVEPTPEIAEAFYEETQGIIALLVMLFMLVEIEAIRDGSETITPEFIRKVATTRMRLMKRLVDAYRKQDMAAVAQFERVHGTRKVSQWMADNVERAIARVVPEPPKRHRTGTLSLPVVKQEAIAFLQEVFGFAQADALGAIEAIGEAGDEMGTTTLVNRVLADTGRLSNASGGGSAETEYGAVDPQDWRVKTKGLAGSAARDALPRPTTPRSNED